MKKPIILVTPTPDGGYCHIHISMAYNNAIVENGGIPLMPGFKNTEEDAEEMVKLCDGILFSGGDDLHPKTYGELTHAGCGEITPERDELEFNLYKYAVKYKKPILGICRGIQLINAAAGGNCIQDIPSEYKTPDGMVPLQHRQTTAGNHGTQEIIVEKNSKLSEITGKETLMVNTFHHQACKDVAPGWVVTGRARDGMIECIENPSMKFGLAVQWHPEHLVRFDDQRNIFRAFIKSAAERAEEDI